MGEEWREGAAGQVTARPNITTIPVGALEANCYVVACPETKRALIIDPGAEPERILARVASLGVTVAKVVHTHGHFDHIGGTEAVLAGLGAKAPLLAHPADRYFYEPEARAMGAAYGYPLPEELALPDAELADTGVVEVGALRLEVIHTPGHTPGSVGLRCGDALFSGDTLFRRGIGRTDLLGGDEEAIYESILTRLYTLPEAVRVYPGHGPETTIGEERRVNPFVRG